MTDLVPDFSAIPSLSDPAGFAADADAFLTDLPDFVDGMNALKAYVDARSEDASAVTLWVSGSDYVEGDPRVSPADKKTYRAKGAITNSTTDPSADAANWEVAGGVSAGDQLKLDRITATEAVNTDQLQAKRTRVLDGAATDRGLWVKQSDGTAKAVTTSAAPLSVGSDAVFNAGASYPYARCLAHDPDNNKMLLVYQDVANSNYGTAVVLTVSGDTVTAGTPAVFESASSPEAICEYDPVNDKFLIVYRDGGNSSYITAIVATISGTSISFGTPVSLGKGGYRPSLSFDTNGSNFLLAYCDEPGQDCHGVVISISGTTPTFTNDTEATTTSGYTFGSGFDSASGKHLVVHGAGSTLMAFLGTISGTNVSFGSQQTIGSIDTFPGSGDVAYSSVSSKWLLAYNDNGDSDHGYVVVLTVSGSTVTAGTPVKFEAAGTSVQGVEYDAEDDAFFVIYKDAGNSNYLTYCRVTISGTVPTPGTPAVLRSADPSIYCGTGYDTTGGAIVCAFRDGSNSNHGTVFAIQPAGNSTNVADWGGFFLEAGADGEEAEVSTPGDIIDGLSGLVYDEEYYPEDDGSLTITPNAYGKIGRAISTTELLQTGPEL